jgi:hypothetical protein
MKVKEFVFFHRRLAGPPQIAGVSSFTMARADPLRPL